MHELWMIADGVARCQHDTGIEATTITEETMTFLAGNRGAVFAVLTVCCAGAQAQADPAKDFPSKPVRLIVGVAAGGGNDATARALAQKLTEKWGRQVVVDNRTGATGAIAVELTAKAPPDGYTLCMYTASQAVLSATNAKLPYDMAKDLTGVSQAATLYHVLYVIPSVSAKSVKELVALGKASPGKLNYGTPGVGNLQHLAWEMFGHMTGAKFNHVPYKGGNLALAASLAGEVQAGMSGLINVRPHVPSGRVRALAITARERSSAAPELPTIAEAGVPGYEIDQWYGVITGAKVPPAIINKLNVAIADALKSPEVVQRLAVDGSTARSSTPQAFDAYIKTEIARWGKLVKQLGLDLS
jgi:tripartite-type tricarboxylate transporter receptor subunit TctC